MTAKELMEEVKDALKPMKDYITKKYKEIDIARLLDDEVLNWIDSDWEEEGFDDEHEWYNEYGRGEAEDVVMEELTNEAKKATKLDLNHVDESEFKSWLQGKYSFLDYR
jgi:hypothetical protein